MKESIWTFVEINLSLEEKENDFVSAKSKIHRIYETNNLVYMKFDISQHHIWSYVSTK